MTGLGQSRRFDSVRDKSAHPSIADELLQRSERREVPQAAVVQSEMEKTNRTK
jgi:hypothetical protein